MEGLEEDISVDEINKLNDELQSRLEDEGIDENGILGEAQENLSDWDSYFGENMTRGKDDMNFVLRDQWSSVERSEFTRLFKVPMVFNRLYDSCKKLVGEQRKNRPDLMVRSLNGRASQQQIDLRTDLVRTIAYQSETDLVYQNAFRQSLMMGYGGFEITLDYESPHSFNKVVRYELITDIARTAFDPRAIKPHKGDGNFCSRQFVYKKEEFYARYPHIINAVSYSDPRSNVDALWSTKDSITVCRYTSKLWFPVKVFLLTNGETVTEEEWIAMKKQIEIQRSLASSSQVLGDVIRKNIPEVHAERMSQDYRIYKYILTQNQIVDFEEWRSKHLPIIFMDGDSNFIDGKQYTKSFIREARDAQKFINYTGSEIAADIKNRRREQWIGTPDNILGNEQMWRNPELQNGILIARPDPKTGQMPQKLAPSEVAVTLLQQYMRGVQDIKEILGISENDELKGRDISGKARRERKMESAMSSYVWFDNANQAIEQGGRVVLDLLKEVVGDFERSMTLTKHDGRTESITLNKYKGDDKNGKPILENTLEPGEYDIEIDTGPSFAVQKEIALEYFQETANMNPQVFNLIADLWADNLDIEQRETVKMRLKTLVPPQVLAESEGKPPPPPQPNPQQIMMQMEMQEKMAEIKNKEAKVEIERQKNEIQKAELLLKAQEIQLQSEIDIYNHQSNLEKTRLAHGLDKEKAEHKLSTDLAKIVADLHKHNNPHEKPSK